MLTGLLFLPLISHPSSQNSGLKVIFALDQINSLYKNTSYYDQNSVPLSAQKFELSKKILEIFSSSTLKNVVRIGVMDHSYSQICSKYLNNVLNTAPVIHSDPLDLSANASKMSLDNVSEFGVILPTKESDSIEKESEMFPSIYNLKRFVVPVFDKQETRAIMSHYRRKNIIESESKFIFILFKLIYSFG